MKCPNILKRQLAAGEKKRCTGEIFYVQQTQEYHSFRLPEEGDEERESGWVDLIEVVDSTPDDTFHFWCEGCGSKWHTTKALRAAVDKAAREDSHET
jgi:hypothetical protein